MVKSATGYSRPRPDVNGAASHRLGDRSGVDIVGTRFRLANPGCRVRDVVIGKLKRQRVVIVAPALKGHGLPADCHVAVQRILAREVQLRPFQPAAFDRKF